MSLIRKNIIFTVAGQILTVIFGLISFKFIYANFGGDILGVISFAYILGMIFSSALDMGLSKTTIKEVAANYKKEQVYIGDLLRCFSFFYLFSYLTVVVVYLFFVKEVVGSWLRLPEISPQLAIDILIILGPASLLSILRVFFISVLTGIQRLDVINIIDVVMMLAQQIGIVWLLFTDSNIYQIILWISFTLFLKIIVYLVVCLKFFPFYFFIPVLSMSVIRRIKLYAAKLFADSLILLVHKQLDKLIMSKYLPASSLGVYSFIYGALSKLSLLSYAFSQSAFPSFSEQDACEEKSILDDNFFILQHILTVLTLPLFIAIVFFSLTIFTFLLDYEKAQEFEFVVIFLCGAFYLNGILKLLRTYCFSKSKPGYIIRSDFWSLFIVAPATIFLIINYGVVGASLSYFLFYILGVFLIVPVVYKEELNKSFLYWLFPVLKSLFISLICYFPLFYTSYNGGYSFISDVIIFISSSIFYLLLSINFLDKKYKSILLNYAPFIRRFFFVVPINE